MKLSATIFQNGTLASKYLAGRQESSWLTYLERYGVYFSEPIDLDFMMLEAYPKAYGIENTRELEAPSESTINAVLGKVHLSEGSLGSDRLRLFETYQRVFKLGSKPSAHIEALSRLSDEELLSNLPPVFERMFGMISGMVVGLPE